MRRGLRLPILVFRSPVLRLFHIEEFRLSTLHIAIQPGARDDEDDAVDEKGESRSERPSSTLE